jgi:hypothetical protein
MDMGSPVVTNVLLGILVLLSIAGRIFQFLVGVSVEKEIRRLSEMRFVS